VARHERDILERAVRTVDTGRIESRRRRGSQRSKAAHTFAELLIDCEENRVLRAVLVVIPVAERRGVWVILGGLPGRLPSPPIAGPEVKVGTPVPVSCPSIHDADAPSVSRSVGTQTTVKCEQTVLTR
jgi:hypothetical protein